MSKVALSSKSLSVLFLYHTVPPFLVLTSAQNGAIILALLAMGKGFGVNAVTGRRKDITPLVLTWKNR